MRVAAISDIHGNLPALRAVIDEVRRESVDLVACCGDIASGPLPGETIDFLREVGLPVEAVRGNADRGAVDGFDGRSDPATTHEDDVWTGTQLNRSQRDYLAGLPLTRTVEIDGLGTVLLCHGTPRRDDEIVLETSREERLREALSGVAADVVVCGNTHMPFDREAGRHRLVNAGSVGMPYGPPGAYWALLGPDVEFRRTGYDLTAAAAEIRARSTWHGAEQFVTRNVLDPPSRARALEFFGRLEADQHG